MNTYSPWRGEIGSQTVDFGNKIVTPPIEKLDLGPQKVKSLPYSPKAPQLKNEGQNFTSRGGVLIT